MVEQKSENEKVYEFEMEENEKNFRFGSRHIQAFLVCIFISISFIMRVNMSVAVVAMTDKTQNSTSIESGLYSALPFMAMWAFSMVVSVISDWITNNKILSTINSRRIFNTFGTWVPAGLLVIMTYIPHGNPHLVIGFFVFTAMFLVSINMGFMLTFIDIAPNFSGTILGMNNFVSQFVGIFAPLVVGFIVTDEYDPGQWQIVFFITSAILFFCNLFYIIFTSTDIQPWNDPDMNKRKANSKGDNTVDLNSEEKITMLKLNETVQ